MYWYLEVLRKYAVFDGRARRTEYWMFTLVNVIIVILLTIFEHIAGIAPEGTQGISQGILVTIYNLALFIPSIALSVRRLHDIGRSGWWVLIIFIPFIGILILFIFAAMDSEPGPNQYGPNPKEVGMRV